MTSVHINADTQENIPGEIKLDEHGKLFQNLLYYQNPIDDIKHIYNKWVISTLERRLKAQVIDFGDGRRVEVVSVTISKPTITLERGVVPLYPYDCRITGNTYGASVYMDLSLMEGDRCLESAAKVEFTKIPVMTGSILCNLYGMSDEKLLEHKECPTDPMGVFVIKGTEKIIISQEKLRHNRIFIMMAGKDPKKQQPVCKITNYSLRGTSVINLESSTTGGIRIKLKSLNKDNSVSVFQIFRILGVTEQEDMEKHVLMFVKEHKTKVSINLVTSFNELMNIQDDFEDFEAKKGKLSEEDLSEDEKKKFILDMINTELFNHIPPEEDNEAKVYLLSMMVARFCEYRIGVRKIDNRDHWGNKRVETAGKSLESLSNHVIKQIFTDGIQAEVRELLKKEKIGLSYVKKMFGQKKREATETFYDSFRTNNWGPKGSQKSSKKEGITDIFRREAVIGTYYQLTRINAGVSRQNRQTVLRIVQPSQPGFVDIVDTPDGDQCGLVKHKALTAQISADQDENLIILYLTKFVKVSFEPQMCPCILNGRFFGFCYGENTKEELLKLKRTRRIYKDACIVYDENDDILYIYSDGGRMTRPLLVVNRETGRLVYDELKEEKGLAFVSSFPNLERSGAIEYIDPWEQDHADIAQSIKDFESYAYLYEQALQHREEDYFSKLLSESDNELLYYGRRFIYSGDIAKDFQSYRTRFTHCEINPNALYGTTSSLMPFADKSPGVRLSFASLHEDTEVMTSENEFIKIKLLKDGDQVLTFDKTSLEVYKTKIKGHYVIDAAGNGNTIHEVITSTGHSSICTNDHPFLVCTGDEVAMIKRKYSYDTCDILNISSHLFFERTCNLNNSHFLTFHYMPVQFSESTSEKFIRLARVVGAAQGGNQLNNPNDLADFRQDCEYLRDQEFDRFLKILSVPTFVNSPLTKREYLSGLIGCIDPTFNFIGKVCSREDVKQVMKWFVDLKKMFFEFGVETSKILCKCLDGDYEVKFNLMLSGNSLVNFVENIGCRYNYRFLDAALLQHYSAECSEKLRNCFVVKGVVFSRFLSKDLQPNCLVSDFETESDNHSFILRSGFISGNCGQSRQALGIPHSNHAFRFDTPMKTLVAPSRPIIETQNTAHFGLRDLPTGETVKLAFMVYTGYNQEDAIIMKRGALERGLFMMVVYRSWKAVIVPSSNFSEEFVKPVDSDKKYRHLDENGVAREGSRVVKGDVLICKKRTYNKMVDGKNVVSYQNETVGIEEDGVVECVIRSTTPESHTVVRIKVRQTKSPVVGDKMVSRSAQKSTIGLILDDSQMPYDENGISPDIIINPHALPTRMTINKLFEMVFSSYGAHTGQRINATAFGNFNLKEAEDYLESKGMKKDLQTVMYSGFTGEQLEATVFTGPCYYYSLKHHVKDKIQMRAKGNIKVQTHQPVESRKNVGGLRFGEMERDSIITHGAARVTRDRLFYSSDYWTEVVCTTCGYRAVTEVMGNKSHNSCRQCDTKAKFGIVKYPFPFKALAQNLEGLGIKVTFTTEISDESTVFDVEDSVIENEVEASENDDFE